MKHTVTPTGYRPALDVYDTQKAISFIKREFQSGLAHTLNLKRVSAPLFVPRDSGLNDNLNGVERPVAFDIPAAGVEAEVVHSLAKWKRMALKKYRFYEGNGLYTDMNAIRRDEIPDNLHSVYVDQWDWEKVIGRDDRTLSYLEEVARRIVDVVADTSGALRAAFPSIRTVLPHRMTVVSTQELEDMYPALTPKEREDAFLREHGVVLLTGIGGRLRSGARHDGRAPDYDDWALNGDILYYNEVLDCAFEISSMGIRVDAESLTVQLREAGCPERAALPFHRALLSGELPLTVGGGIGQSRLCMLMMGCAHIGEVQCSVWDDETVAACAAAGIPLL